MPKSVSERHSIYREGITASTIDNLGREDNPYGIGTTAYTMWDKGWLDTEVPPANIV